MTFSQAYAELEHRFKMRVKTDNEGIFLPNIKPQGQVDFVLIGMEPSLGKWASNLDEARTKIERGFKNFAFSIEDFILHFCVKDYLCKGNATYYITDLSKSAMIVSTAALSCQDRYEGWYPLLEEELQAVAKPETAKISIGEKTGDFLSKKGLSGHVGTILHYSPQAAKYRGKESRCRQDLYREFSSKVSLSDIERTAEDVLAQAEMGSFVNDTLKRLRRGKGLTDSRKRLMFDYKTKFDSFPIRQSSR